jgi:hypothetical protein
MKSISRRALVALTFAFLTFGTGTSFAGEPSCCEKAESCCSSGCCKGSKPKVTKESAERFRAKYGREYPGTTPAASKADDCCCKSCC